MPDLTARGRKARIEPAISEAVGMADVAVRMAYPKERDLGTWAERHGRDEIPSEWPYGLERLRRPGAEVVAVGLPPVSRLDVALNRALPRGRGPAGQRSVAISWDENVARRILVAEPRNTELYSGVIWATDAVRRRGAAPLRPVARLLNRYSGLFVLSRAQIEPLRDFLGPDAPPVSFVQFGVDDQFFTAAPYPERPLVLSVGGDRDRDAETLFAAFDEVARKEPGARLVVQTTSDLTPPPRVEVVPDLQHVELRALYRRASVVALATRENLHVSGMTVSLEAMATGRPVVITGTPGMEDYVQDGENGLVVARGDASALAAGVLQLLGDTDRAKRMGARGRAFVELRATSRHLADDIARVVGF